MSSTNIAAGEDVDTEEVGVSFLKGMGAETNECYAKKTFSFFHVMMSSNGNTTCL